MADRAALMLVLAAVTGSLIEAERPGWRGAAAVLDSAAASSLALVFCMVLSPAMRKMEQTGN